MSSTASGPRYSVRPVAPILGTGFNRWLIGGSARSAEFTRWKALLRQLAFAQSLLPNRQAAARMAIERHQPFIWESLVLASVAREWTERFDREDFHRANVRETPRIREILGLFGETVHRLKNAEDVRDRASRFARALLGAFDHANVLSLNVDGLFEAACEPTGVRTWYPHGHILRNPSEVTFGYVHHTPKCTHKDALSQPWLPVALNGPLLLLGVGFERSELDLSRFLHLRARNLARVQPAGRPRVFRLTCDAEASSERAHWESVSDVLEIQSLNLGKTWEKAWEALLAMLGEKEAFNTPEA
jgi:hypothetical protein